MIMIKTVEILSHLPEKENAVGVSAKNYGNAHHRKAHSAHVRDVKAATKSGRLPAGDSTDLSQQRLFGQLSTT